MDDTKNDGHLHLIGIGENQTIFRAVPARIETKKVCVSIRYTFISVQIRIGPIPTGPEDMKRLGKYVVVYEACIHGKCAHEEEDVAAAKQNDQQG